MNVPLRRVILAALLVVAAGLIGRAGPIATISRAAGQVTPTRAEPLVFSVVFSEAVTGFDASDVESTAPATVTVSASTPFDGTAYTVSLSSIAEDGLVCLSIQAGAAVGPEGVASEAGVGVDPCVLLDRGAPPPPDLSEPLDGAATSDLSPRFAWTAPPDPSGIARYEIEIRGPKPRDYLTTRTSYTPTLGLEGPYTWRVNALDRAGNLGDWTPWRAFVLDATPPGPPDFVSASVATDSWSRSSAVVLEVSPAVDAGSGVAGYCVVWNHDANTPSGGAANRGWSWEAETYVFPADGAWWCHAAALDAAGNRSATVRAGPFLIDRTPPDLVGWSGEVRLPNDPGCLCATADWSSLRAVDALDPSPSLAFSVPAGARLPIGSSDVIATAADRAGNSIAQRIPVTVYNTEPPVVRIDVPRAGTRVPLGSLVAPTWTVSSLAPLRAVRTEGLSHGVLDAQRPGRQTFAVTVTDSTGLSASAEVEYVVTYAAITVELFRVAPNGEEQALAADGLAGALDGPSRVGLADWLRVRCAVDASLAGTSRPPVSFSLVRFDSAAPDAPILERLGVLRDDGEAASLDLPLVVFRPGRYVLWLGFVDGTSVAFPFDLLR